MATTAIQRQYAKAVFVDHTRTYDSIPTVLRESILGWAGTSNENSRYAPTVYLEDLSESLAAGCITQAQYDQLLIDYPGIPKRPVFDSATAN